MTIIRKMKEKGKVVEKKGEIAVVMMEDSDKCERCGLCKKIVPREPLIEAENKINADIGDNVFVEIDEDILFKISLFVYGFPLIGFILGIIFSYFLKILLLKILVFLFFFVFFWITGFKKVKIYGEKTKPKIISKI
jgi:positive regulator of sigma E activity